MGEGNSVGLRGMTIWLYAKGLRHRRALRKVSYMPGGALDLKMIRCGIRRHSLKYRHYALYERLLHE
jgi:hypothetical protein